MKTDLAKLSRREREMLEILYARGKATAAEVREAMRSPPSYSAVRATLRILENKGYARHTQQGTSYCYAPTLAPSVASRSMLSRVVETFFGGSPERAMVALLDLSDVELSVGERQRLLAAIRRKEGEKK